VIPILPTVLAAAALLSAAMFVAFRGAGTVVRYRLAVVALALAATAAAGERIFDFEELAFRLTLDPSEEPMLDPAAPHRAIYDDAVANFGSDDIFVVVMATDDVFTHSDLAALRTINTEIRRIAGVRSAKSLVETTAYGYDAALDTVKIEKFIDDIPTAPDELASLKARALADRLFPKTIVSRDGRAAAINVAFRTMSDGEFVEARIDEAIAAALEREASSTRRFYVTGRQHIKAQTHGLMIEDLLRLIPLAVLVGAFVAWLVTGSLAAALVPVGTSLLATTWTYGWLIAAGRPLTLIGIVLGPMLICVGSVYGVHVMAYFVEAASSGEKPDSAARLCIDRAAQPVAVAGLTTVAGFSALAASHTPAVRELGLLCVFGIAGVTLLSLTFVPALLASLPASVFSHRAARNPVTVRIGRAIGTGLSLAERAALSNTRVSLAAWSALTALALFAIPRIAIDTDYISFFDDTARVRLDFAAVNERLTGSVPLYVTVDGGGEGAFREPDALAALESLQSRLGATDGVDSTLSILDIIEPLNRAVERDDPAAERIPATRGEVAELYFLAPKNEIRRFMNSNQSRANVIVRTSVSGSAGILDLERRIRDAIVTAPGLPDPMMVEVTGNTVVVNHSADSIARDQITTVAIAALTIFVLIGRSFGSLSLGLLAMVPNVIPVLLFFGVLGIGAAPLSLPTSLVGCIALGIAVDDTAHFLAGYRRRRHGGSDGRAAIAQTVRRVGRPIATTSFMLIAGFSVLQLSNFATLRQFGALAALTMGICLAADLVLLPALLAFRENVGETRPSIRAGTEDSKS
jgi:predicted RND superfamily exporter protein